MLVKEDEQYKHPQWGRITVKELGDIAYDTSRDCAVITEALIRYDDRNASSVGRNSTNHTDWVDAEELAKLSPIEGP